MSDPRNAAVYNARPLAAGCVQIPPHFQCNLTACDANGGGLQFCHNLSLPPPPPQRAMRWWFTAGGDFLGRAEICIITRSCSASPRCPNVLRSDAAPRTTRSRGPIQFLKNRLEKPLDIQFLFCDMSKLPIFQFFLVQVISSQNSSGFSSQNSSQNGFNGGCSE